MSGSILDVEIQRQYFVSDPHNTCEVSRWECMQNNLNSHSPLGRLADLLFQASLQVHLSEEREQQSITIGTVGTFMEVPSADTGYMLTHSPYTTKIARIIGEL